MTHEIQTQSATYKFTLYPADTKFYRIAGIYIFLIIPPMAEALEVPTTENQQPSTFYNLLYAGITNDFYSRLKQHHKIEEAQELGMTHIGILKISSGRKRKKIEREILKHLNPPLNQTWLYNY